MANAEVGDEQRREDPTVNELERRAAQLLGQEEAVFVPTATMANEIALSILGHPGDELIAEENSHVLVAELGGPAVFAGLMTRPIKTANGRFTPDDVRSAFRAGDNFHVPKTRVVSVENTHNAAGGRVWPLEEIDALAAASRDLGL
jgi:threonine aldolase